MTPAEAKRFMQEVVTTWPLAREWDDFIIEGWLKRIGADYEYELAMEGVREVEKEGGRFPPSLAEMIQGIEGTPIMQYLRSAERMYEGNARLARERGAVERAEELERALAVTRGDIDGTGPPLLRQARDKRRAAS